MSHTLAALQQHVDTAAESFCRRSGQPPTRRRGKAVRHSRHVDSPPHPRPRPKIGGFYRPRDHEASPFFKIVRDHFDEFEKVYTGRYQDRYGFWRPVIRSSIDKFLKCGDLKEGFAQGALPGLQGRVLCCILLPSAVMLSIV